MGTSAGFSSRVQRGICKQSVVLIVPLTHLFFNAGIFRGFFKKKKKLKLRRQ